SPYNTYTFAGFPAGAICNPGLASILAAVHPNDTDYYYFAAGVDGHSHFFTNVNDHFNFVNSDQYKKS
ncbi:MAG: endolytic transglycosylase MltG, partial [Oscillospiraceae bacterium]|nr:endolytic transglycosylase MltG [Oscillospiraceae bacterium]